MKYWDVGVGLDLVLILALLAGAALVRRGIPGISRLALPDSMVAGGVALALGPTWLGWIPLDSDHLEAVVYHGLAILFLAVGLRSTARRAGERGGGARSIAFGIPLVAIVQALIGLSLVLLWPVLSGVDLHPGYGLMLPLAFSQGPGQALSLGSAWESTGMAHGAQVGLILAALGYATCCAIGVPLIHLARWRGWVESRAASTTTRSDDLAPTSTLPPPGAVDHLTRQLAMMATLYLVTFAVLTALSAALATRPAIQAMVWGFHFIVALLLALGFRVATRRLLPAPITDDHLLSRVAALVVDITTASAIGAVRPELLTGVWAPVLTAAFVGAAITCGLSMWLARRAFPDAPFEHGLVLFGASSGTMPTGLALLRVQDPQLEGPASRNAILGVAGAIPLGVPLLLVVVPMPVVGWPASFPGAVLVAMGISVAWATILLVGWRLAGPLRFTRPLTALWPGRARPDE